MKQAMILMFAILATVFCSCSDDDDKNSSNSLNGTTWVSEGEEQRFTLVFQNSTVDFIYEYDDNGDGVYGDSETKEKSTASYTQDGNKIVIKDGKDTAYGTISGNNLTLGSGDDAITYHKK